MGGANWLLVAWIVCMIDVAVSAIDVHLCLDMLLVTKRHRYQVAISSMEMKCSNAVWDSLATDDFSISSKMNSRHAQVA